MRVQITVEGCENPFCEIHTAEENEKITSLAEKIKQMDDCGSPILLYGWDGDYCIPLKISDIYRVFSQDKKVFVETEKEILLLKMRLFEFEEASEKNGWLDFIRISNTDIVNFSHIKNLDMTLTGIIKVNFTNQKSAVVSRRYMNKIRGQLCLKKQLQNS